MLLVPFDTLSSRTNLMHVLTNNNNAKAPIKNHIDKIKAWGVKYLAI